MLPEDREERLAGTYRPVANLQSSFSAPISEQLRQSLANIGTLANSQIRDSFRPPTMVRDAFASALKPKIAPFFESAFASTRVASGLDGFFKNIIEPQRRQMAEMLEVFRKRFEASMPPNWRGSGVAPLGNLETLLLDEGLPLAWVPPKDVLIRVLNANDAADRRRVIGGSWKKITNACLVELDATSATELTEYVEFARLAADALQAGHHQASQALSANTLDTMIRTEFDGTSRGVMTGRKARLDIEEYPLRWGLVLGGIWGAHAQFWPQNGDSIPRNYSRHGTAHGVSRRQYSRINSVLALMHLVSLIRCIETDFLKLRADADT